jgi:hypothetical protein
MHAVVELIASVVVWMAVAALNHFGVQVSLPGHEPEDERVITRDNATKPQKSAAYGPSCPPPVRLRVPAAGELA